MNFDLFTEAYETAQRIKRPRAFSQQVRQHVLIDFTKDGAEQKFGMSWYTLVKSDIMQSLWEQKGEPVKNWLINELKIAGEQTPEQAVKTAEPKLVKQADEPKQADEQTKKPQTMSKVEKTANGISASLTLPIADILMQAVEQYIPSIEQGLQSRIEEAAKALQPNIIQIAGRAKDVEITGTMHNKFNDAIQKLRITKTLMLSGPTGSGKTFLSEQLAKAMDLKFGHLSCTAGMSEAHITGRMLADGSYVETEFVNFYENGGVFLFDEVDAADPNTLLLVNSALSNGYISLPNRKDNPKAKKHSDFHIIVASNTWGKGSFDYSGREVMDEAFLDRFRLAMTEVNYDEELELKITKDSDMTKKLQSIRKIKNLNRSISTRTVIRAYQFSEIMSKQEILDNLTMDWSEEEKALI